MVEEDKLEGIFNPVSDVQSAEPSGRIRMAPSPPGWHEGAQLRAQAFSSELSGIAASGMTLNEMARDRAAQQANFRSQTYTTSPGGGDMQVRIDGVIAGNVQGVSASEASGTLNGSIMTTVFMGDELLVIGREYQLTVTAMTPGRTRQLLDGRIRIIGRGWSTSVDDAATEIQYTFEGANNTQREP